jgi:serine/threonine-protein kinase
MNAVRWQRAKEIYQSVIEQEPQPREAFLAQACAGDESLRKEVESLLACRPEAENLMALPALDVAARELAREQSGEPEADLTGRSLSHYRIIDKIGEGGMGVVYQAEDLRLGRVVALKFLSGELTGDKQAIQRFQREARAISALNHPHICTLHDVGEHEGRAFLVMEHVAGETLAERLAKGPLMVDEALEICRQIAEGLEAAHEKGIIHRDLKPANVRITPGGKVKILDFGLARALRDQAATADLLHPPTITEQKTDPGTVLGTAAYMSPEQARGKPVDKRADIWAFGCVLYECLTGKRAFEGITITETIAAILKEDPDWQALPAGASENLRAVLRRCLQKDPDLRLRDVGDARIEIGESAVGPSEAITAPRRLPLRWLGAAVGLLLLAGIPISLALIGYFRHIPSEPVVSTIKIEPGRWLAGMNWDAGLMRPSRTAIAISTDNSFMVYSAIEENPAPGANPQLYLRRMGQAEARPIAGTEGGINPFLSPDNRWVGFWADRKLKKVPVEGGIATPLCDAPLIFGANWGRNNRIVFSDGCLSGLSIVTAEGGTPRSLTTPDPKREETSHRLPVWLPSGEAVLFTVMRHSWDSQPRLALLRLDTGEWQVLLEDAADARYVPTGHLVFVRQGVLMAVRFDPAKSKVIGEPHPIVENVMQAFGIRDGYNTAAAQFAISEPGWLVYASGGVVPDPMNLLVWVDQRGNEEPVTELRGPFYEPRLSPDGQRIAYATMGREPRIWVYDLARGTHSPLTSEGFANSPIWTATGKRLVFLWMKSGLPKLFWQPYDGSLPMEPFIKPARAELGWNASDGKNVALPAANPGRGWDIVLFDTQSGRETPFLNSPFDEAYPEVSPDGRWIAYTSNENNKRSEVYVQAFPGKTFKCQVSIGGGVEPLWSRNGRQLFYRWQDQMWVVNVQTEGGFAAGKPVMLFKQAGYSSCFPTRCGDLSLDSQRFLMVKLEQRPPTPVTELILVQNWFEELKRLVPTGKN